MTQYDSALDTLAHIQRVRELIADAVSDLMIRAINHDASKLRSPEKEAFDRVTPKLRESEYGSPEYKRNVEDLGHALEHHYENNDHHPEYHHAGIRDMDLLQVMEMLCDWLAAVERHADGDIIKSIEMNAERFGYGEEMKTLLLNTVNSRDRWSR
jgi:hypothetical protein